MPQTSTSPRARAGSKTGERGIAGEERAEADRLLALLAAGPVAIVERAGAVRVAAPDGRVRRASPAAVDRLLSDELAVRDGAGGAAPRLRITETGLARLARLAAVSAGRAETAFLAQHADLRAPTAAEAADMSPALVNDGESPLAWLRRRKGADGRPLLSDVHFAAGERLRADLARARALPRVTADWSAAGAGGGGRRGADPGLASDVMLAARQRVDQALRAAGPELAGLLLDVCGFLKRLPDIERERGWPARSAKLVLDMALARLARHYGLSAEARGPDRSHGLRFWGAEDYRPEMDAP
jgi:hypothetical protein